MNDVPYRDRWGKPVSERVAEIDPKFLPERREGRPRWGTRLLGLGVLLLLVGALRPGATWRGRILLAGAPVAGDPLEAALDRPPAQIGVLAIKFGTRQRIRLNGAAQRTGDGILLTVTEAFGNCAKYIQRRIPTGLHAGSAAPAHHTSAALDARHAALVRGADTFFIASTHPQRGADASHRGGRPGFAEVTDGGRLLTFPDYLGNRMFQTLGNLTVNPQTGLLFLDWETGSTLQLTGRAQIVWDAHAVRSWPRAERLVQIAVHAVHEHERAMPARWGLIEPHQRNPPVNQ